VALFGTSNTKQGKDDAWENKRFKQVQAQQDYQKRFSFFIDRSWEIGRIQAIFTTLLS
jgi:hypothetical protein